IDLGGSKKFSSEGGEGYGVASDRWFDDNVFTIVVHRRFVDEKLLAAFDAEPVVLPPWDAMS
ncbi:C1 family peptidase, partial [Bacillus altitudinis]|uniref:C1 family peptidase n=1 Tax=Bacillus altitudinis TaxID=293387 RepID=UPI0028883AED